MPGERLLGTGHSQIHWLALCVVLLRQEERPRSLFGKSIHLPLHRRIMPQPIPDAVKDVLGQLTAAQQVTLRSYIATLRSDMKSLEEQILALQDHEDPHAHYHGHEKCTADHGHAEHEHHDHPMPAVADDEKSPAAKHDCCDSHEHSHDHHEHKHEHEEHSHDHHEHKHEEHHEHKHKEHHEHKHDDHSHEHKHEEHHDHKHHHSEEADDRKHHHDSHDTHHDHQHSTQKEAATDNDAIPEWKKKALESDPMAAPFGGDWSSESMLDATKSSADTMEE